MAASSLVSPAAANISSGRPAEGRGNEASLSALSGQVSAPSMNPMTAHDPSLYNDDLAPIPIERRTWGTYNYASLWVAMSVCIPTYMLASGLIAGGMSWWQ